MADINQTPYTQLVELPNPYAYPLAITGDFESLEGIIIPSRESLTVRLAIPAGMQVFRRCYRTLDRRDCIYLGVIDADF